MRLLHYIGANQSFSVFVLATGWDTGGGQSPFPAIRSPATPAASFSLAARIARSEGVTVCDGTRVFGATVPNSGAGLVLARAGKALDARGASSTPAQPDCGAGCAGAGSGFSCAAALGASAGSAATMAANSTGVCMAASIQKSILAPAASACRRSVNHERANMSLRGARLPF